MGNRAREQKAGELSSGVSGRFNQAVYQIVSRIPHGMVTTYGSIARALGDPRKSREVGWALNVKPKEDPAPAHRVVNREGRLSGGWAFGSPEVQRGLLEAEGVAFLPDGRVDLQRHIWQPEEPVGEGCAAAKTGEQPMLF